MNVVNDVIGKELGLDESRCPYCKTTLDKRPKRKSKCKHCSRTIYVKKTPDWDVKRLMTADEAAIAESLWSHKYEEKLLDQLEDAVKDSSPVHRAKMMALHIANAAARNGQDYMPFLIIMHQKSLEEIAENCEGLDVSYVKIVASGLGGKFCDYCKSQDGTILKLEDELIIPSLPFKECNCKSVDNNNPGFCISYYEPVFDDELPPELIPKLRKDITENKAPTKSKSSTIGRKGPDSGPYKPIRRPQQPRKNTVDDESAEAKFPSWLIYLLAGLVFFVFKWVTD